MAKANTVGLEKSDYRGAPTTLCAGCGHNSISNQIIQAAYDLNLIPEDLIKFSGIGCSSKSPTYFLDAALASTVCMGACPRSLPARFLETHDFKPSR